MKPYYDDGTVTIYHGDCRDVLPTLTPVDLVLTDPPYGLGDKWTGGSKWVLHHGQMQWDQMTVDGVVEHLTDAGRHVIVWGGNYYPLPPARCWLLWDKKQNDNFTSGQAEMAWTNLDRPVRTFRMSQVEAYGAGKSHPTEKPLQLMTWCVAMVRDDTIATVLDPFMGSGTTLRAAKDLGHKAIGVELDERYCEIAARRMAQEVLDLGGAA